MLIGCLSLLACQRNEKFMQFGALGRLCLQQYGSCVDEVKLKLVDGFCMLQGACEEGLDCFISLAGLVDGVVYNCK